MELRSGYEINAVANVGQKVFQKYFLSFLESLKEFSEAKSLKKFIESFFKMKLASSMVDGQAKLVYQRLEELKNEDKSAFDYTLEKDEWARKAYFLGKRLVEEENKPILPGVVKKILK